MSPRRLVALVSAATILVSDRALSTRRRSRAVAGALDEPAHAATTVLLLAPWKWPLDSPFALAAITTSVTLDLDHLPQYLGHEFLTADTPRPYPHSGATVAALGALALASPRRRPVALGAALGVSGHFLRDMAQPSTTAGVALLWPFSKANLRVPYSAYATVMGAALAATLARRGPEGP